MMARPAVAALKLLLLAVPLVAAAAGLDESQGPAAALTASEQDGPGSCATFSSLTGDDGYVLHKTAATC